MRRFAIHSILPTAFVAMPVAAGVLLFFAVPPDARHDYLARVAGSPIDWLILALGALLFVSQTFLARRALQWDETDFDKQPDKWLTHLSQAAEWFPLLGLIGTVAAILQTFGKFAPGTSPTPQEIIRNYAPAITATGSGLFMAFLNILPTWVVAVGREMIRGLAGGAPDEPVVPLDRARDEADGRGAVS
jgi:hypothetical protein